MPPLEPVRRLISIFKDHLEHYESGRYNETQLRREFLDPFFQALGWDVGNEAGYADAYKDVIHGDSLKIGASTKAPDYCFRIGGTRKFFLEAKKPSINVRSALHPAYQLRRYAWSAKLPLSILSNFEEFAVYDTRIKPASTDSPAAARTFYCTFEQFEEKWDEIAAIFSRDAILKGSFDKYAEGTKRKRGTAEVDDAFLAEIERWRELLAKNFALRNPQLTVRDLNFAVQITIDRLIFLRICEDRGTQDYGLLRTLCEGFNTYERLRQVFLQADERYNSGLFHFNHEKEQCGEPDTLTLELVLDDKPLKDILHNLYYPDSPYEFSVLPADILGQIYERFLGKTISLSSNHRPHIEEKPEVRKAGGVYYTPTYIVDYIVKSTLGRLLDGPDPERPTPLPVSQVANIKVLDPACGSGSFLIAAYQLLLDWHRNRYVENPSYHARGKNPKIYQSGGGDYRLTTAERKRVLINNIYGVDIDRQAVEVTKLSLLLKVLEGQTEQIVQRDWLKERERILPDLGANIRCGNSLIDPTFYANEQMLLLDEDTKYRLNVFDWEKAFPEVMKRGGFDCVIGNPPWGAEFSEAELEYLRLRYPEIVVRMIDSFMYFVAMSLSRLHEGGQLGMILPDVVLYQRDNWKLRELLISKHGLNIAINAGDVFDAVTRPAALIAATAHIPGIDKIAVGDTADARKQEKRRVFSSGLSLESISLSTVRGLPDYRIPTRNLAHYAIVSKLLSSGLPLLDSYLDDDKIQRGVSPDLKEAFVVPTDLAKELKLEEEFLRPVVTGGRQIQRYYSRNERQVLLYTHRDTDFRKCPRICSYIDQFRDRITCKEVVQRKHPLHALHRARSEHIFTKPEKLLGVITEDEIILHLDEEGLFATDGLYLFSAPEPSMLRYLILLCH